MTEDRKMGEPSFRYLADGNPSPSPLNKPPGYGGAGTATPKPSPPPAKRTPPPITKPVFPPDWVPPRKQKSTRNKTTCCRCFCCYFCLSIFILILFSAILGSIFYVYFEPRTPEFRILSVKFPKFTIKSGDDGDGSGTLAAHSVVKIELRNPNEKLGFDYSDVEVKFTIEDEMDEGVELGYVKIPDFVQGKMNTTMLKLESQSKNVRVNDGEDLKEGFKSKLMVVNVMVESSFGLVLPPWNWKVGKVPVEVHCSGMTLKSLESHGGNGHSCSIRLFNMIKLP